MSEEKADSIPEQEKLQQSIDRLNATVDHLAEILEKEKEETVHSENTEHAKEEDGKKTSKVAVTGAMAFAGLKAGGGIGAQIGMFYNEFLHKKSDIPIEGQEILKAQEMTKLGAIKKGIEMGMGDQFVHHVGIGTFIGGALGASILGFIGWKRGDRIKDPGDLLKHPFESIGKILSDEEKSQNHGKGNWQEKVSKPETKAQEVSI